LGRPPALSGGEFYGEFATYDVMLDLSQDQVIGATGVPVEGDPGWDKAKADPALKIVLSARLVPRTTHDASVWGGGRGA